VNPQMVENSISNPLMVAIDSTKPQIDPQMAPKCTINPLIVLAITSIKLQMVQTT